MTVRDDDYLKLLSKSFPNQKEAMAEIINLSAIMELPKGTEYFLSDIHGEYEAFSYLLRSSSGVIRSKIRTLFDGTLSEEEQLRLANLVIYPKTMIAKEKEAGELTEEKEKELIRDLVLLAQLVSSKYTRSKVRKKMPSAFGYALDELIHTNETDINKAAYHEAILEAICKNHGGADYIVALCELIQNLTIDHLHIVGDIYDRGPRPDKIMDELMAFHDVDIQRGNHDISWLGASMGNLACICNVLHIATLYNSFDVLEDGYGINLRPLSMYAKELYANDPCERFKPHLLDHNVSDSVEPELAAKMCKVVTILFFKLEGQLILRHLEYGLGHRLLMDGLNIEEGTVTVHGKTYRLLDENLPTIGKGDPRKLTEKEEELLQGLQYSFTHSEKLHRHMAFLLEKGSMYLRFNGNLLFHGCVPMDEQGEFLEVETEDGALHGRALMDYYDRKIRWLFAMSRKDPRRIKESDICWYLWCGPKSPLFGKDQITTFERTFIDDPACYRETYNPYYSFTENKGTIERILKEFGLDPTRGHIINGHVPVLVNKGESPVKAEGKLFRIDGGLSKSYQSKTGIAGYTLIFNSHHLAIAEHSPFRKYAENTPSIRTVEEFPSRYLVRDTDIGARLKTEIEDLQQLIRAFREGRVPEKAR